jgi:hypothetical protein
MVELSRRSLLCGIASVAAVAVIPSIAVAALAPNLPVLYGDGIHDDAPAIQAIVDHKPVMLGDGRLHPNDGPVPCLPVGNYRIDRSVTIIVSGVRYDLDAHGAVIYRGAGLPLAVPMVRIYSVDYKPFVADFGGITMNSGGGDGMHLGSEPDWNRQAYWEPSYLHRTDASYHDVDDGFTYHYAA